MTYKVYTVDMSGDFVSAIIELPEDAEVRGVKVTGTATLQLGVCGTEGGARRNRMVTLCHDGDVVPAGTCLKPIHWAGHSSFPKPVLLVVSD